MGGVPDTPPPPPIPLLPVANPIDQQIAEDKRQAGITSSRAKNDLTPNSGRMPYVHATTRTGVLPIGS